MYREEGRLYWKVTLFCSHVCNINKDFLKNKVWKLFEVPSYVRTYIRTYIHTHTHTHTHTHSHTRVSSCWVHPLTQLKILFLVLEFHSFVVCKLNVTPTDCMEIYSSISAPNYLLNREIKMSLHKILTTAVFYFYSSFYFSFPTFGRGNGGYRNVFKCESSMAVWYGEC